ncbi:IclR family transcriptional regulator [Spirillospora sp. CA-255316]
MTEVPGRNGGEAASARPGTQAVDRAIAVLRSFEGAPQQTPTQIAHRLGLTVSTAHRIVRALRAAGMLGRDPRTDGYFLGPATAILGRLALERMGTTLMQPELTALRDETGEAVSLGVRVGDEVAVLVQIPSVHPLRYDQEPGARNPIHVCAMGKALLAYDDARVSMAEPYRRYTPATITTRAGLDAELGRIRRRGYATNDEERIVGVRALAAPIHGPAGQAVAAVTLQGPAVRFTGERLPDLAKAVMAAAERLTGLYAGGAGLA